ncbi:MAG TPA: hypothetical protein VJA21_26705 [Verrucomicrobiae bacterium]
MPLYTIIAEHDGGTYISQHQARIPGSALAKWLQHDDSSNPVHGRRRSTRERLSKDLLDPDNKLVPLDGCVRVWCTSESVRGKLLLLNIVETKA